MQYENFLTPLEKYFAYDFYMSDNEIISVIVQPDLALLFSYRHLGLLI